MVGSRRSIPIVSADAIAIPSETSGCAAAEPFALRVIGDSMAPEFVDGHIVIVDPVMPLESGAYVVADYDGETVFRQYWVEGAHRFLKPLNADYATVEVVRELRVRGVVVQRAGRRRREHKHYY
ncbi:MAG: S24 family peptidase [Pseudomonadota bacterium]|nr:MAG: S24 family peptidase [Pseudomonadota bacterium]